jgi:uncharacterized protein involved in exopolysaccharide biosynthesis
MVETQQIALKDLLRALWRERLKILGAVFSAFVLGVVYLALATPKYTASVAVGSVEAQNSLDLGGALGQLSSLSGLGPGSVGSDQKFEIFIDILASNSVASRLADDTDLMQRIFKDEWDDDSRQWRPAQGLVATILRLPDRIFGLPNWSAPSASRLADYLRDEVAVSEFGNSGLREIAFTHADPEFALQLLGRLYAAADENLREDALERSRQYIAYLERRLRSVAVAEHRAALGALLGDEERKRMLIEADVPFAARIVSPVRVSELPTQPKVVGTLILAMLVGLFFGVALAFLFFENGEKSL